MRVLVHFYKEGKGYDPDRDETFAAVLHQDDCSNSRYALPPYGENSESYWERHDSEAEALGNGPNARPATHSRRL